MQRKNASSALRGIQLKGRLCAYSRLMNVVDRILVDGFPVIVALGLAVILMALIANVLA
jgi:hypothetical protein